LADNTAWLESLPLWPEEFGTGRMLALLAALGDPQRRFPSIHVVGTKGKGTTTRTIEETLTREGLRAGGYYSPHIRGWAERISVDGAEADLDRALARVREAAVELGATQFEVLTAAAFAEFAAAGVDAAAVEAGLGGRLDATNVVAAPVVVLTNVALEHTAVLGETRPQIAAEKLAVLHPGATAVLGEPEWEELARANGALRVVVETGGNRALGGAAASAFLGRPVEPVEVHLPGRLERRGDELWDGAHTPEAIRYIEPQLPELGAIVASILEDKSVEAVLELLAAHASVLVATQSSHPHALPAAELARRARPYFPLVETEPDPGAALRRARTHAGGATILVTGSLYLLADLAQAQEPKRR
jgi:dihydrofolate synthase/folylpolyglutamate synthase